VASNGSDCAIAEVNSTGAIIRQSNCRQIFNIRFPTKYALRRCHGSDDFPNQHNSERNPAHKEKAETHPQVMNRNLHNRERKPQDAIEATCQSAYRRANDRKCNFYFSY
jgi:hypothetical protein